MQRYNAISVLWGGLTGQKHWKPVWGQPAPKPHYDVIGDEPIWLNGNVVGWVTSGGYAHNSGVSMAIGYVPKEHANAEGPWEIELLGDRLKARVQHAPIWDANAERMRG